jgi:hypothetical protein
VCARTPSLAFARLGSNTRVRAFVFTRLLFQCEFYRLLERQSTTFMIGGTQTKVGMGVKFDVEFSAKGPIAATPMLLQLPVTHASG